MMIDEHFGDNLIPEMGCHPGVVKALHDCLQEKYSIMPNSGVWYYIKEGTDSACQDFNMDNSSENHR